jgi:hypothetical protein
MGNRWMGEKLINMNKKVLNYFDVVMMLSLFLVSQMSIFRSKKPREPYKYVCDQSYSAYMEGSRIKLAMRTLRLITMGFHGEFHGINYHDTSAFLMMWH